MKRMGKHQMRLAYVWQIGIDAGHYETITENIAAVKGF